MTILYFGTKLFIILFKFAQLIKFTLALNEESPNVLCFVVRE